jgi:vancomycin resistance protein YoaR
MPKAVFADDGITTIQMKTDFNIWKVDVTRAGWINEYPKLSWNGIDVKLPDYLPSSLASSTNKYLTNKPEKGIDFAQVKSYLDKTIEPEIHRDKQDVTIKQDADGKITFDGFALSGQDVDFEKTFYLIQNAFATNQPNIRVPLNITPPNVNVESEDLKSKGIVSLLSTGETNFKNSPKNRRVNIRVGLNSFNGKLVASGAQSGAGAILGRVDGSTGYLPELVIKGDKTVPEFGGGLCQVSTTVYRSLLFAGLPILERRNHSYAVSYYDPQGLDATIYPPNPDLKFKNDTSNYILIQTTTVGDKAYSNIYGTPVARHVDLIGPYYFDYKSAPPARTEYTDKLPVGVVQKLGAAHPGFKANWYRRISYDDGSKPDALEQIYSSYEARPNYTLIGTGSADTPVISAPE